MRMSELKPDEVWSEFYSPVGELGRAVTRCMVFACAVGLLVLLGMSWLFRSDTGDVRVVNPYDTGVQVATSYTIAALPVMFVVYGVSLLLLVLRPAEQLLSVIAAAAGSVSTCVVLLAGPDDIWDGGAKVVDYEWQAAPFLALGLWIVALVLTARLRWLVREG
jgi:hypothetical protein